MAGAGIGTCVICGRENQPLVSDICQHCHNAEFLAGLERAALGVGARVYGLNQRGWKVWETQYLVVEGFAGGWHDVVKVRSLDDEGRAVGLIIEIRRDRVTSL